ncbi:PKD domain-containing protein [Flavobacterium sp. UBA6031]|uniref:PKD domain-containing protein n=1 Tax=Flavobacterium sp. UBA6031 TaxID=1946551 RepID=UPI0025C1B6F1|nr:PKD domain-containing protein [Flavobacterium sp. UBA6031]
MNFKLNILTVLSLTFSLLTFVACDNTNGLEVKTAEFSVNNKSVYLTETVTLTAKDSLGGNEYSWDFGDGSIVIGKYNMTHKYEKGGRYLVTMTINGMKSTNEITVKSGSLSFRIINNSATYFDCLTYLDNYSSTVSRFLVNPKSESDTIYSYSYTNGTKMHIFGVSFFIENSEYTLPEIKWIENFKHTDIIVTDTTKVVPRSGHGFSSSIMIKDL